MSKSELKSRKRQLRADFIKLKDEIDSDIVLNLCSVERLRNKGENLFSLYSEIVNTGQLLEGIYSEYNEIEQIAKIQKELEAVKDLFQEANSDIKQYIQLKQEDRVQSESATARKLAEFMSSDDDEDNVVSSKDIDNLTEDLYQLKTKSHNFVPDREKLAASVRSWCQDLGFITSKTAPKTSTPVRSRHVSFNDPLVSSVYSYDCDQKAKPLLSSSDILHGYGKLPGARTLDDDFCKYKHDLKSKQEERSPESYMQKIHMPIFDGSDFLSWWSMFEALVDDTDQPIKVKFLRLKQSLQGDAYELVKDFPHDERSYHLAKKLIYDTYGGLRRQNRLIYQEVENFTEIGELEFIKMRKLLGLVTRTIRLLETTGQTGEIGPSRLHSDIVSKLHANSIYKYHDWVFNNDKCDDLYSLSTFLEIHSSRGIIAIESSGKLKGKNLLNVKPKTKPAKMAVAASVNNANAGNKMLDKSSDDNVGPSMQSTGGGAIKKKCRYCKKSGHPVFKCEKFLQANVKERWSIVKTNHICHRCLSPAHHYSKCDKGKTCGIAGCQYKHNRLLHDSNNDAPSQPNLVNTGLGENGITSEDEQTYLKSPSNIEPDGGKIAKSDKVVSEKSESHCNLTIQDYKKRNIALGLAIVKVYGKGTSAEVVALIDSGSNASFLSQSIASYLQLEGEEEDRTIRTIGGEIQHRRSLLCELTISDRMGTVAQTDIVEILPTVVEGETIPSWHTVKNVWPHLRDVPLMEIPPKSKIDLLLGVNYIDLVASKGSVTGEPGDPVAIQYPIGWVCVGCPTRNLTTNKSPLYKICLSTRIMNTSISKKNDDELNQLVQKFWEIEECFIEMETKSSIDKMVEERVKNSLVYRNPGYQISIPWIYGRPDNIKSNRASAIRKLLATEKRLLREGQIAEDYKSVFQNYIDKGYLIEIDISVLIWCWYLPHFPVIKYDRQSTKVRPVFNASDKFDSVSINDLEYAGPKKQQNLIHVLLRFRRFRIAIGCDISEMYLRVWVDPLDQPYQLIVWRNMDLSAEIKTYAFTRVTFGRKSSPFLALLVSQENALRLREQYPEACEVILHSTYMDDSLDSVHEEEQAFNLYKDLNFVWGEADMTPKKWLSNSAELLSRIPEEMRLTKLDLTKLEKPVGKMLGALWDAWKDCFLFELNQEIGLVNTKRLFLKKLASIFDPLGLIAPFVLKGKIIFQSLWLEGVEWDETLPSHVMKTINKWFDGFGSLAQIQVNRVLMSRGTSSGVILHIFADASEKAFGCVCYIVDTLANPVTSRLVLAKTKLAPLKMLSIPRLELEAACLAVNLLLLVNVVFQFKPDSIFYWTDSQDVLCWLCNHSRHYKVFVGNRVGEIHQKTQPTQWKYVPTESNPADLASRGYDSSDFAQKTLWWEGPEFIRLPKESWPTQPENTMNPPKEMKTDSIWSSSVFSIISIENIEKIDVTRWSSWNKAIRVIGWVLRALVLFKKKHHEQIPQGELEVSEIERAESILYRLAQKEVWGIEISQLQNPNNFVKSKLAMLTPWLDDQMVMRGRTRLDLADYMPWDEKFPILLPGKHWITTLIIRHVHESNGHAGVPFVLSEMRKLYQSLSLRERIRAVLRKCVICRKRIGKPLKQLMGSLPFFRVEKTDYVFQNTAVDFAGPFFIKQGRGKQQLKRWLSIFTCLSVRAVHIEIADGLSTDDFLLCLSRFTNKRGVPKLIYCDNGTNFHGTSRELEHLVSSFDEKKLKEFGSVRHITWKFMPAQAPHMGGVHEIVVKAVKRAMVDVLYKADLTQAELHTAVSKTQGMLNNRPLTYQSTGGDEIRVITPNHFIFGHMHIDIAPPLEISKYGSYLRKRWERVQELNDHIWNRWTREWLSSISTRSKWLKVYENIDVNDIVIIIDNQTKRNVWPLGRVTKVFPGKDGLVRTVEVLMNGKRFVKPIVKLILLPC